MELTEKFEKDQCKNPVEYSIIHKEIPIKMPGDMWEAISYLLWYVPDISSIQSKSNELISNMEYDYYTFIEIMTYMDLKDEDCLFTDKIDEKLADEYKKKICTNSQKLILTQSDGETKTESLLRHIRNAIAHGSFNIVEDLMVGFDEKIVGKDLSKTTAIFKIKPKNLLNALKMLNEDLTNQKLIAKALKNTKYWVEPYQEGFERSNKFDLFAKKDKKKYAIEIRNYKSKKDIDKGFARELAHNFKNLKDERVRPVLVINTSFLKEESKNELIAYDVLILDVKNIKKMLKGRDMIREIEQAQTLYKYKNKI
ncbi:hypothetical protein [Anaerococcus hydrogenalis]|uniref:Restriction endonuclease type IV Mrr domain-containing protein n=3 Tax=Anaerococcus hydrogenalis TaxID=33029 RepID=B6WAU3_9FIRM|nr:hypothetical protein [Anaerococcus hydrogenalis]EEB35443.1 hypothetical protein ANHYDRO_01626 [Anaerococcus hydrogenalis DSM 7454]MBS5989031.1 hypothetical protein [Anaerococcus hydrogenalis]MDK7695082.1 hypothetical protein [Anaerococcus hydrogenalis]MDK7696943.1 hypothetical protein [Anaerococcus hydrogenalis]MDK7708109.1 hypothetical protein [Anaerococcus hydrogenalis]